MVAIDVVRGRRADVLAAGVLTAGVVVTTLTAACGASLRGQLDMEVIEHELAAEAAHTFVGAVVGDATCPESREYRLDDRFTCTVVVDGQLVEYEIHQTTDDGEVEPRFSDAIVPVETREFEALAARFVRQNEAVEVAASCGAEHWLFLTGPRRVDCRVDYGDLERGVALAVDGEGVVGQIQFTQARLDLPTVNDRVVQQLIGPLGGGFLLACPATFPDEGTIGAFDPGDAFDCTAYRELVEIATIHVTVRDVSGALDAAITG